MEFLNLWNDNYVNLADFAKDKDAEKKFNKIFPWWKAYLQVSNNHVIEVSFDKTKWIVVKDLGEWKKSSEFDVWWVKIQQDTEWLKFDSKTKKIEFPKQIGWWKISGTLEKWNDKNVNFILWEKIAGHEIKLNNIETWKINSTKLFQDIEKALLYIGITKKDGDKLPDWIKVDKKTWKITLDCSKIKANSPKELVEKLKTDSKKLSETFIMDTIWENVGANYWKIEDKKDSKKTDKKEYWKTEQKTSKTPKPESTKASSKKVETTQQTGTSKESKSRKSTEQTGTKEEKEGSEQAEKIDKQKVKKDIDELISDTDSRLKWMEVLLNSEDIPKDYKERLDLLAKIDGRIIGTYNNISLSIEEDNKTWKSKIKFPSYKEYTWESIVLSWNNLNQNKLKWIYGKYPKSDIDDLI